MNIYSAIEKYTEYYASQNTDFKNYFNIADNLYHFTESANYNEKKAVEMLAINDYINLNIKNFDNKK